MRNIAISTVTKSSVLEAASLHGGANKRAARAGLVAGRLRPRASLPTSNCYLSVTALTTGLLHRFVSLDSNLDAIARGRHMSIV